MQLCKYVWQIDGIGISWWNGSTEKGPQVLFSECQVWRQGSNLRRNNTWEADGREKGQYVHTGGSRQNKIYCSNMWK